MLTSKCRAGILLISCLTLNAVWAQTDTTKAPATEDEEDYSQYENASSDSSIRTWCNPKIFDLSPNRFVSLGYDYILKHSISASPLGSYKEDAKPDSLRTSDFSTSGLRLNANIPIISRTRLLWQLGGGYTRSNYNRTLGDYQLPLSDSSQEQFFRRLDKQGLHALNLNSTVFVPLGEKRFIIVQLMAELNGNYSLSDEARKPDFSTIRSSGSLLYGKRPHDRFQWAVGLSRTYRAGELNYIPVVMYNYTSVNRKWGTEILFPARAAYRRKFNSRSILLAGYELEGSSYRLYNTGIFYNSPINPKNLELRRSELRFRLDYQRQLIGFFWISVQAGVRQNYTYNVDSLGASNKEIFRGFFGTQPYAMLNTVGFAPYCNVSINLVSP